MKLFLSVLLLAIGIQTSISQTTFLYTENMHGLNLMNPEITNIKKINISSEYNQSTYYYNTDGKLVKWIPYYVNDNQVIDYYIYNYDSIGRIVKTIDYSLNNLNPKKNSNKARHSNHKDDTTKTISELLYDSNGNETYSKVFYSETKETTKSYKKYDSQNNLIFEESVNTFEDSTKTITYSMYSTEYRNQKKITYEKYCNNDTTLNCYYYTISIDSMNHPLIRTDFNTSYFSLSDSVISGIAIWKYDTLNKTVTYHHKEFGYYKPKKRKDWGLKIESTHKYNEHGDVFESTYINYLERNFKSVTKYEYIYDKAGKVKNMKSYYNGRLHKNIKIDYEFY